MNQHLTSQVDSLVADGGLLDSAAENLKAWLAGGFLSGDSLRSIAELLEKRAIDELNNRFYRQIAFGTGGMRGRTIGAVSTAVEVAGDDPVNPGVGSNMLNEYTVARATIGLFNYAKEYHDKEGIEEAPRLVIAHDVRYFSRFFCELSASVWSKLGGKAYIFDGPRSTPQLSFTVRKMKATCGIVITASHNPSHDNGYKVYFADGGQVVPPNDSGIIAKVNETPLVGLEKNLGISLDDVVLLGADLDAQYVDCVVESVIDDKAFHDSDLKIVFTPIHGTGAVATLPSLERLGLTAIEVEEQMKMDSGFSTVKSPNPENSEALDMAIRLAEAQGADALLATDPDCDRMGVAVKGAEGKMVLLTGNQIGSIMAEYRITELKSRGWIPRDGSNSVALVKTFVTSPLQDTLAASHGIKVINTLTGFKWIGEKLKIYETTLKTALGEVAEDLDYDSLPQRERARLLQEHSTYYVFGGEESYGYLPNDSVRDKDGNAACVIFCELLASLKNRGISALDYLDELYLKNGYFLERLGQLVYEGASGAAKIARILKTYRAAPPTEMAGIPVSKFTDFGTQTVLDPDGKEIPKQDLYFVELENGYRYGVRGSGTEPKIKFYLFGREQVDDRETLSAAKEKTSGMLQSLNAAILADAEQRADSH